MSAQNSLECRKKRRKKKGATHVDVVQTTQDTSSKLTPKRVPNSVLDFFLLAISVGGGDADPLLAIDRFTGSHVSGDEQVFLALGDVDTFVLVGFEGDSTGTLPAETGLAATTTASTAGRTSTTGSTSSCEEKKRKKGVRAWLGTTGWMETNLDHRHHHGQHHYRARRRIHLDRQHHLVHRPWGRLDRRHDRLCHRKPF